MISPRLLFVCLSLTILPFSLVSLAQDSQSYSHALTDRSVHSKTPMAPPPVNTVFFDHDFASAMMVRATDETTNFKFPGGYLMTEASGAETMWSADTHKFYVIGQGGVNFAFGFDPLTMMINSLPGASPGKGLVVPLRAGPTFSFVDPDLLYGTTDKARLTISSYRFSTGALSKVVDTTTCGTRPALVPGPTVVSTDDVSVSATDNRLSISEGGSQFGTDMFVIVYDKNLGCRWYNTQTGEIGGQWGPTGTVAMPNRFLISHAYLSKSGDYVRISVNQGGRYIWNVATTTVTFCSADSSSQCGGYLGGGYSHFVNVSGFLDGMNILIRPFSNIKNYSPLVWPLPNPHQWTQQKHFSWSNANSSDTNPVCGSTWTDNADGAITTPWEGEIFCLETDGAASTIWRFAHNRASGYTKFFNTQPLGSVSQDGRFFLFTSDWDEQVGISSNNVPRSDAWIVKLD